MALSPKKTPISEVIRTRIEDVGRRYWANDNC
jgi:hypothetical protein